MSTRLSMILGSTSLEPTGALELKSFPSCPANTYVSRPWELNLELDRVSIYLSRGLLSSAWGTIARSKRCWRHIVPLPTF
ncbi:hypothetical protein K505DRAFT_121986 [Melanomma pulvis-pyrius CBS 109.77]|uniref:Uncharacterized protein n=1 Tax=Melanomma pulvis-pyrius CBS 109.77 TaxID=1314802 RepID=A0A6A6WU91_9PLEO|nr:hypothetical protein K505DRAFT_121986 [Melanomma pulvis-pyrius CBS 109.77]